MSASNIGFVGLGAMGLGMSTHLLRAGFNVKGFDINPDTLTQFVTNGGTATDRPKETARDAHLLFVCVFNDAEARDVLFGDDTIDALPPGATVIMNTTMAPNKTAAIADDVSRRGHHYLDAPITGGRRGADEGTLTAIVSGSPAALAAAKPALEAMSSTIYHVADTPGAASRVKMINQMVVGVNLMITAEAIAFAAKAGIDPQVAYEIVTHGSGNSVMFEGRARDMFTEEITPGGDVGILLKDLTIVQETAEALSFPVPLTEQTLDTVRQIAAHQGPRARDATVIGAYEKAGQVDVLATAKALAASQRKN